MKIEVNISECLSSTKEIEVPDDYEYDPRTLKKYVEEQIMLPHEILHEHDHYGWYVDDFCVS